MSFLFSKLFVTAKGKEKSDMTKQQNKSRAPDLDKYITEEKRRDFVSYSVGAKMFDLCYWPFVRLAKEAGAAYCLRKTAVVDVKKLEEYLEECKQIEEESEEGVLMASRKNTSDMDELLARGKKYMRIEEAKDYFSVGKHTMEKWAKQSKAIYKINGVKLINIAKIEEFIEAFEVEEDD